MPELPEVETVRTGLAGSWIGKRIDGVDLRRENLRFPFPEGLAERLTGRTVTGIRRRAKYLLIDLDNGDILLSHLGMSGKWTLDASECEGKHDHVVILFDDGSMSVTTGSRPGTPPAHPAATGDAAAAATGNHGTPADQHAVDRLRAAQRRDLERIPFF